MMNKIKVSACIITYNQEQYIRECLDGAVAQQLDYDYEIVIGDDKSTDNTLSICKEYEAKYPNLIRIIAREKNLGMNGNWKETLLACGGNYIAICEGDDYWTDPLKLQKQVGFLESNPDYVLAFHCVKIIKSDGQIVEDFLTKVPEKHETVIDFAQFGNYIHTPSVVFRNVIKNYPFEFEKSPIVDQFLYLMLGHYGKMKYFNEEMGVYRYGVGVFSGLEAIHSTFNVAKLFSCSLSYFKDEKLRAILLQRQFAYLSELANKTRNQYTSNDYLSTHKTFLDIIKIAVKKIIK